MKIRSPEHLRENEAHFEESEGIMANYKILPTLESLRSKMVMAGIEILKLKDKDVHVHAQQLFGAAEMVQNWIENIREGR